MSLTAIVFFGVSKLAHAPATNPQTNEFDKQQHSIDQAASIWTIVNKHRKLPSAYKPANLTAPNISLRLPAGNSEMWLRSDAAASLEKLVAQAKTENLSLMLASAYRSYSQQQSLHDIYVKRLGREKAEASSARAGHSEHQTGLAADLAPGNRECEVETCFGDLPEGKWLAANSHRFGFIISYPKDKQDLTGYEYEPWHIRYVGLELAAELYKSKKTLEQFFGLENPSSYKEYPYELVP